MNNEDKVSNLIPESEHKDHDMMSEFFKMVMKPFQIFHSTISGLMIFGVIVIGFLAYREIRENRIQVQKLAVEQEFVRKVMYQQNQQNVLYKIIDTNLKASMDDKLRTSQALWNRAQTKGNKIPLSLLCAIFERESGWCPTAVNAESGATGLGQQIFRYAVPYLREMGVEVSPETLKDPAIAAVVTYDQLYDHQTDWVRFKKLDWSNWSFALYSYAWGGRQTQSMDMTYTTATLALQKKYKDLGID